MYERVWLCVHMLSMLISSPTVASASDDETLSASGVRWHGCTVHRDDWEQRVRENQY